jgi:hypothetical protein
MRFYAVEGDCSLLTSKFDDWPKIPACNDQAVEALCRSEKADEGFPHGCRSGFRQWFDGRTKILDPTIQTEIISMNSLIFSSKPCRALTVVSSLIFLIILSACADSPRATLAQPDDAQGFLEQALAVTFSQESYRFSYAFKSISTGAKTTSTGFGTFQGPDRIQGTSAMEFSAGDRHDKIETATISIGADLYTKHNGAGEWTVETVEETTALPQMNPLTLTPMD